MVSRRERRLKKSRAKKAVAAEEAPAVEAREKKPGKGNFLLRFYDEKYKVLLIIPFGMLLAALIIIGMNIVQTGDFIDKDVSLKGGLTVTVLGHNEINPKELEKQLNQEFPDGDVRARALSELGTQVGLTIDASDVETGALLSSLSSRIPGFEGSHSVESIGPELGESFFRQTMTAVVVAFLLMALVVFYYFRIPLPCIAVVLAALSDIIITVAVMDLMNIRLSTAGIAALLMLIGYSVDTDILLSSRVLKGKEGTVMSRILSAVKTGLTMNVTTLVAIVVALMLSQSDTITQIMTILLIGLLVDIINTWIQNVGILRLYLEKK